MSVDPATLSPTARFEHLLKVISSDRFLNKEGLGNEVPFFICPFDPRDAFDMADRIKQLAKNLGNRNRPVRVLIVNLYDLSIELLRARGVWDSLLQKEAQLGKAKIRELLQNVLDSEAHLVPAIEVEMARSDFDVLFLTGVGEVFPYIRSHNVLNNLQRVAKERPTVLFFPGRYVQSDELGASLILFERLPSDKYYRAFNIFHFDV